MARVITFEGYTPSPRYDSLPWTEVGIEEAVAADGPWVELERQALDPVDADPKNPASRNFTTELASDEPDLWYRGVFYDATGDESQPTDPVQNSAASSADRDLCTLADVTSYIPAYVANAITDRKLRRLISAESDLIHDEAGREIVAKGTQPATRTFEISTKAAQLRQLNVGDLASTDDLVVSILHWDGTVSRTVDLSAIVPLYEGERQPTRDWEPITELSFPWGRPQMPVFIPQQALELTGTFGFPQIPRFVREACAKRVIIRYVSDVAHSGTDFANAVEQGNLNLAAMFNAAEDAIQQLSGRVVLA